MTRTFNRATFAALALTAVSWLSPERSLAQSPQQFAEDATRYMALGDSIAAGFKAMPVTNGYTYLLYQDGVFDRIPHTLFCNAAVPSATSHDVLLYQVPEALIPEGFSPKYITLTVGGNDLLAVLAFAATHPDPNDVLFFAEQTLAQYGANLGDILQQLRTGLPEAKIFVGNQYTIPEIQAVLPFTDQIIGAFNAVVAQVVSQFAGHVYLVDAHTAFLGRNDLLLIERHGASPTEVHLTDVGHRVMEKAFASVIEANK